MGIPFLLFRERHAQLLGNLHASRPVVISIQRPTPMQAHPSSPPRHSFTYRQTHRRNAKEERDRRVCEAGNCVSRYVNRKGCDKWGETLAAHGGHDDENYCPLLRDQWRADEDEDGFGPIAGFWSILHVPSTHEVHTSTDYPPSGGRAGVKARQLWCPNPPAA